MRAYQRFRGGPLHECPRFGIEDGTHEIVGGSVADIELDSGIERRQLHKIRLAEIAGLLGRLGSHRPAAQRIDWFERLDVSAGLALVRDLSPRENYAATQDGLGGTAISPAAERQRFAVIQAPTRKTENVRRDFLQRVVVLPF